MSNILDRIATKNNSALLIVDMLNDFLMEESLLSSEEGRQLIPRIKKLKSFATSKNIPTIYIQEIHRKNKVDFGITLDKEPERCYEKSPGSEITTELKPDDADYIVVKRRFSGFFMTDLDLLLKGLKTEVVILTGLASNMCVYATALDAVQRDYRAVIVEDCVAGTGHTSREIHRAYLENFSIILGDLVSSEELIKKLK